MDERPRPWPWRVSLVLAALVIAWTLNGFYETWRQARLTGLMFPSTEIRPDWSRIGLVALFGIVLPLSWLAIAWRKAFPRGG